jgi:glutamate N-acetyltransferase/amino-acid N-acetyltransferase
MEAPLVEVPNGTITTPQGFTAGATAADIRGEHAPGRLDLGLLYSDRPCAAAAVYTTNSLPGAALIYTRERLTSGRAQALIANSGCANALTGERGLRDAEEMARLAAERLGVAADDVAVASTGVTGTFMPMERVRTGLPHIALTEDGGDAFAHAIMTTDTVSKQCAVQFEHDGRVYSVGGVAKGSGMIEVNMATMLGFLTTDAPVDPATLQRLVRETADVSFNMLTIDGDTSPDDIVLLLANGAAGGDTIDDGSAALPPLHAAIERVSVTLTRKLARDGEGATKLIEVRVDGAATVEDARRAAKTIARSPLVKTAVYGNDPNWGRVLVAVGYSGAQAEEDKVSLAIQGVEVYRDGAAMSYEEAALSSALDHPEVRFRLDLGLGKASATAWGCDLTPEYVHINSEYTT